MGEAFDLTGLYAKERAARPIETHNTLLKKEIKAYKDVLFAFGYTAFNTTQSTTQIIASVGQYLDPDGSIQRKAEEQIANLSSQVDEYGIAAERKAFCKAEREKDEWASPSSPNGWLCVDSPNGLCSYEKSNHDDCDYCGFPDERT